ncbi:MAG TPA: hypothetical protein VFC63_27785 [Blastocatellia bacterium]|nr:hypothetical protein [Blastocatellia bacterium]
MRKSLFSKPDVTPVMKCISCGETLLFGREQCIYCGQPVDPDYAIRSAIMSTYIAAACSWANSIRAASTFTMLLPVLIDIAAYVMSSRVYVVEGLCLSIFCAFAVGYWCWRYSDVNIQDAELDQARKEMKRYLNRWLGFIALQIFILVVSWSSLSSWIGENF